MPSFAGNWSGTFLVQGCAQTGGAASANLCSLAPAGTTGSFTLTLTQSGSTVTGSFTIESTTFPGANGTVASDGSLSLQGSNSTNGVTEIADWRLDVAGSALTGTFTLNIADAVGDAVTISLTITSATHSEAGELR